ncbi:MAG TPA: trypsin-like peptidase domain-containing protein, partial [Dehalococcoidia bacterium]|nr:trypsin-like peptidase domain-containing protein [Dehalococcoidia bacterium]
DDGDADAAGSTATATANGNDVNGASGNTEPDGLESSAELVEQARPSIVHIETEASALDIFGAPVPQTGVGTGFIIDGDGNIVTNDHVISLGGLVEPDNITVTLADGETFDADVVGRDPFTDLAIIHIDAGEEEIRPLELASSEDVRVGDTVIAIGHALNLQGGPTVTRGVVSAKGRAVTEPGAGPGGTGPTLTDAIQTDAAINSGNSGGPLLDSSGRVIGVNTLVERGNAGGAPVEGIGFAISSDTVRSIAEELIANGQVERGFLGINFTDVPGSFLRRQGIDQDGAVGVVAVEPGSPADSAGLQQGDIITKIGDRVIRNNGDLTAALREFRPGETVEVEYYRGADRQTAEVTLSDRPEVARPGSDQNIGAI